MILVAGVWPAFGIFRPSKQFPAGTVSHSAISMNDGQFHTRRRNGDARDADKVELICFGRHARSGDLVFKYAVYLMPFLSVCFMVTLVCVRQVRVWEINRGYGNQQITAQPKAQIQHDAPVLCTEFSADGTTVFSGGASKQVTQEKGKKWRASDVSVW